MNRWLSLLFLFTVLSAQAAADSDGPTAKGIAEFTAAYQEWDGGRFATAADLFREATIHAPAHRANFYWLGVTEFHRTLQVQSQPASEANELAAASSLDAAIDAFTRAVKLHPEDAESHALLGTLYGMKIDGNVIRAARYGSRIEKHCQAALEHGSRNPRVRYLLGTCQFHTAKKPGAWRAALNSFLEAERLYEEETSMEAGPLEPRWGYSSCLTFTGLTYERLGQLEEAADYFRKALARHPSDHLAKEGLSRVSAKN